jgi:hypothetical protein
MNLNEVDLTRNLLAECIIRCSIKDAKIVDSKKEDGFVLDEGETKPRNLLVIFETLEAGDGTLGKPIGEGYKLRRYYPLQDSVNDEDEVTYAYAPAVCELAMAALNCTQKEIPNEMSADAAELADGIIDAEVLVKVGVEDARGEYGASNSVKYVNAAS